MFVEYTRQHPFITFESDAADPHGFRMVVVGVEPSSPWAKYLAALLYYALSLGGLTINAVWGVILYAGHRHYSSRPFYIVSRHLLVGDLLVAFAQFAVAAPLALMSAHAGEWFRRTLWFNYCVTLLTVGRFATLVFVFLQCLSQIAPFVPNRKKILYHISASGSLVCMFGWVTVIGMMLWLLKSKCRNDFDLRSFHFFYECSADPEQAENMWTGICIATVGVLLTGVLVYGVGFRMVQQSLKMTKFSSMAEATEKKEVAELKRIRVSLLQGFLIVFMESARVIAFAVVPEISSDLPWSSFVSILANCIELMSVIMHPLVFISFNERAQKYLRRLVSWLLRQKVDGETHAAVLNDPASAIGISQGKN
ncbi:hypothetical protein M3Y99_01136500 [Aphelenchoides fujianensis]|nr:hypothetical protein M3Y99_01136500 [Aphelenchoides fujianensis]